MLMEFSWAGQRMSYFKAVNETSGVGCRRSDETPLPGMCRKVLCIKALYVD